MNAWDEMSKTYPHYGDKSMMKDVKRVLDWCDSLGVKFENEILDVGCGTGVLDLCIAQKSKNVKITGLDVSKGMLNAFLEDAKKLGVEDKISTIQSAWEDFDAKRKFDCVIASMSPAINSPQNAEKLISLTRDLGLYVGWGAYKDSEFLNKLVPNPNPFVKGCVKTRQMGEILAQKGFKFEMDFFDTSWENVLSPAQARQYANSMLLRCELEPNAAHIERVIAEFSQEDGVHILTKAQKGMIIYRVK